MSSESPAPSRSAAYPAIDRATRTPAARALIGANEPPSAALPATPDEQVATAAVAALDALAKLAAWVDGMAEAERARFEAAAASMKAHRQVREIRAKR
jgi:hypothetical protein